MQTRVVFLKNKSDLFAFFPDEIADSKGNKMSYSRIGQHSACCVDYALESKLAEKNEYASLASELISIGYDLEIMQNN